MAMEANPSWNIISISISIFLLFHYTTSEQDSVKLSLISFLQKLSGNDTEINQKLSWKISSDPCTGSWTGVTCNNKSNSVRIITLQGYGLSGSFDPNLVCNAPSLSVLSLSDNHLHGQLPLEISSCTQLTHLFLSGNQLSGQLPSKLSELKNLKRLDISDNNFSGDVPSGLTKISGLVTFLAEDNQLTGSIPAFDFDNLQQFNVSNNLFSGAIPPGGDLFSNESFSGNSGLCGQPLAEVCAPAASPKPTNDQSSPPSVEKTLMYLGYILLGLAFLLFFLYKFIQKKKKKRSSSMSGNGLKVDGVSHSISKNHSNSSGNKSALSEHSTGSSTDSAVMSTSLVVLKSPAKRSMRFDDLLKSPAELMGRGRNGSVYKVMAVDGSTLVVRRIKGWMISSEDFRKRMELIDRAKHRNVLPLVAFYCSKEEKLLVYEFQHNGSLLKLIHGSQVGRTFDWGSRLNMAVCIAEGMSFMHGELQAHGIGHGNLKSSNIIMNNAMDPCISEFGLMSVDEIRKGGSSSSSKSTTKKRSGMDNDNDVLKKDVYGFGNILLELLTGKLVENNGADLAEWVNSVVREEWTVEVFDKALVAEGASEERMVHLLQVALKCVSTSLDARPTMAQVSSMISSIKEEEERSGGVSV